MAKRQEKEPFPSISNITEWLETSGYPFELSVARLLHRTPPWSPTCGLYLQDATGQHREIDVSANYQVFEGKKLLGQVRALIECKFGKQHPPCLLYTTHELADEFYIRFVAATDNLIEAAWESKELSRRLGETDLFRRQPAAHGIVAYRNENKNGNRPDPYYSACQKLVTLAAAACQKITEASNEYNDDLAAFVLPILAIRGPLFGAYLDASGPKERVQVIEQPYAMLFWGGSGKRVPVWVVTEAHLEKFVAEMTKASAVLAEFIRKK
jgi:hypothetical protein